MQKITIILISITFIRIWIDSVGSFPLKPLQKLRNKLNFKPFNCSNCLSFWLGIILSICFLEPLLLSLPLFTKIYEKL